MALVLKDRVKEGTSTSGTGTIVLLGAAPGYQSFAAIGNGNTTYYTITNSTNWEVGIGTYYSGNTSLSRDTILASSNANAAIVLSGTSDVFVTYPAEEAVYEQGGKLYSNGSSNVSFVALNTNLAQINTVTITSGTIATAPNVAADIANKQYVDTVAATGLSYHAAVQAATTANLATTTGGSVTYNQPNGAGNGVGATLTLGVALNTLDGYSLVNTNRVLIKNEANQTTNGIYTWATGGTVLTRATDADTYGKEPNQLSLNDYFYVQNGNVNKGSAWIVDSPTGNITFGTSNIAFAQFSSSQVYSNGTGLTLSNTTFSISNTAVVSGSYGNAGNVAVITVNPQGQLTNVTTAAIVIPSSSVTGLGTMAVQNATSVAITGGSVNGTLIGNATPSTGAFTNLSASGTVSGVGFANYLNSPPTIGGVTANTGAFTSLSAANTLTASANVVISQLTGYLYGNNSSPLTASTTIPNTAITGLGTMSTQNANNVTITGGTINNVSLSNITYGGLGTMATQNANAVAITGGAINGTVLGNTGPSTAVFTNMNTTTGNATTINVTNSTITNLISGNAAITGGSVNGTPIGNVTASTGRFSTITGTGLTSGRVTYATTSGLLTDSANLTFNGTTLTAFDFADSSLTAGRVNYNGVGGNLIDSANLTFDGSTLTAVAFSGSGASLSALNASNLTTGTASVAVGGTGLNSLTNNSVILGNGTNAVKFVAPGTSGNVLTSDGTTWTSATPAAAGALAAGNSSIIINNVNITANANINAGQNGFSVGPVTTANGVTVTIASGQSWVVI